MVDIAAGGENKKYSIKPRKRHIPESKMRNIEAFLYVLPWIIGFLAFQIYPFLSSFYYSLTDYTAQQAPNFIGFENYINIFTRDAIFYQSLFVTLKYVFIVVPAKLGFALFIAMILNLRLKGINWLRTVYYLPSILGGSVGIALLWRFLFNANGAVNHFLVGVLGLPRIDWIANTSFALGTVGLLAVWQFGSSMVLFLAALKQVPASLYEAALIDGSGPVRNFFQITIPMISPIILFNLIMQLIVAFQEFSAPFLITSGGPLRSTYLYSLMIYENAFTYLKMGYSSALSWILFIIVFLFTLIIFKTSSGKVYYEDGEGK